MRMVKSAHAKSWIDSVIQNIEKSEDLTFSEERAKAEAQAVKMEQSRKATASKYPDASVITEKPGFKADVNDQAKIVEAANRKLVEHLQNLSGVKSSKKAAKGMAGTSISVDEVRVIKAHKDIKDDSNLTDKAYVSFNVKYELPGLNKYKTAKYVVCYDFESDTPYTVANTFYDENLKEHQLTSVELDSYLKNTENKDVKTAQKQLVWFNPEVEDYEEVVSVEPTNKVVAHLKASGFKVDESFWPGSYGCNRFNKLCSFVNVPMNKINEFKKIAAMKDEEWVTRGLDGDKQDHKFDAKTWPARTEDKHESKTYSYTHEEFKKGEEWKDRASEEARQTPKNPYSDEKQVMLMSASKKEETKEETKTEGNDILNKIENLEKKLG